MKNKKANGKKILLKTYLSRNEKENREWYNSKSISPPITCTKYLSPSNLVKWEEFTKCPLFKTISSTTKSDIKY